MTTQAADFNAVPYPDNTTYYNGGWFDPTGNNTNANGQTYKYNVTAAAGLAATALEEYDDSEPCLQAPVAT